MRKLVTVRTVGEIEPIDGADAIEVATIDGWKVVVKKGEFLTGHPCVYFEIDSFLPIQPRFEFLRKSSFKRMGDQEGFHLRTVKLRGQISQGLVLRMSEFPEIQNIAENLPEEYSSSDVFEHLTSLDLSEVLGVQIYEPPVPAELAGQIAGNFPSFMLKTEQERCQNIIDEIFIDNKDSTYEITMKMDGTSFTAYHNKEDNGVCGRNWELKINNENAHNTLVRMYIDSGLHDILHYFGGNYAVQGELMGPGIQGNREGLKSHCLFVFDIFDIDNRCYLEPNERHEMLEQMWGLGLKKDMVKHVPVIAHAATLYDTLGIQDVNSLLKFAEGPSLVHSIREGLVFKRVDGKFSFKAISNKFLLKVIE